MNVKKLIKSFEYAVKGIFDTMRCERNMRIHIVAASLVIPFAWCFGISKTEWAVLFLTIGFVISAELMNTASEHISDAVTKNKNEQIRRAKDSAAGGVLISAAAAVMVGLVIFSDFEKIIKTLIYMATTPRIASVIFLILICDVIFLVRTK